MPKYTHLNAIYPIGYTPPTYCGPEELPTPFKKRVEKVHDSYRLSDAIEEKANLDYVKGKGTAFWKNNKSGTLHEIRIHEGLFATVDSFKSGFAGGCTYAWPQTLGS